MRERGPGMPPEEMEKAQEARQRASLETRFSTHGDLEVEGVPDDLKARFAAEKLAQNEEEISRLRKEAQALEALRNRHGVAGGFTDAENRWFAGGEEAARKEGLRDAWETLQTLDVEGVSAAEKVAFAEERLKHLRGMAETDQYRHSEALQERIKRLEMLWDQYVLEAETEKGEKKDGGREAA